MKKIPLEYNKIIHDFYVVMRKQGHTFQAIADMFNHTYGVDFAESSLRTRYQNYAKGLQDPDMDYEKELIKLEVQKSKVELDKKIVQRKRQAVNSDLNEIKDKQLTAMVFAEAFKDAEGFEAYEYKEIEVLTIKGTKDPIYAGSDVHMGYEDRANDLYGTEEARDRLMTMAKTIIEDVRASGVKEFTLIEGGDQIEGRALRVSQLERTAEHMGEQAKLFMITYMDVIKLMSKELPDVMINFKFVSEDNHSDLRLFKTGRGDLQDNLSVVIANGIAMAVQTAQEYDGLLNVDFEFGAEILIEGIHTLPMLIAHGHQYKADPKAMHAQAEQRHDRKIGVMIVGHWHNYKHTTLEYTQGTQQAVVHLPALVGETDFGKRIFRRNLPGFLRIDPDDVGVSSKMFYMKLD